MKLLAGTLLTLVLASGVFAQDVNLNDIPQSAAGKAKVDANDPNPHPVISYDSSWAQGVVIGILGMFVAAMLVGAIVPAPAPAPVHGHDDHDHAAHDDHSHGAHGHEDHAHGH